jgi:uncharacterized damage-inducible protein DinB
MGDHPVELNATMCDDLQSLRTAREEYQTLNGTPQRQPMREILAHMFNHQTHHRGQAHMILTVLGVAEPEPLDLLIMFRMKGVAP